ncbi:MAG: outer rane adhesin like protein, partial [Planctomycetaceae bacterium]|nr:outer rane adhesin like protein [Planctomycetaceae bacterium]
QVRVADGGTPSLATTQTVTVNLSDVNDPPVISPGQSFSIADSAAANSTVGTVLASDPDPTAPDNTLTYSILGGNTGNAFAIDGTTGRISVNNPGVLNFSTTPLYTLQINVADGGSPSLSATQNVTIHVTETNHIPSIPAGQSFSINENSPTNTVLGTVNASDPDSTSPNNTLTYSITSGNINNAFTINSTTGQLSVVNSAALNFEATPSYTLQIKVADGGTPSLSTTQLVNITVNDVNEAPTIPTGQVLSVPENAPSNTVVGVVSASDPDSSGPNHTLTYSISSGNTNSAFSINSATGQVTVNNSAALTFANQAFFTLGVTAADGGSPSLSTTQNVRVNLIDLNEAPSIPTGQVFTIAENLNANAAVGTVQATDPDATAPNKTLTFSIVGGDTNNAFSINPATGQINVNNAAAVNFEATPQFVLQVQVVDGGSPPLSAIQNVTVNLTDVNEAPVVASGQSFSVNEQTAANTVVGTVSATDPDTTAPNNTLTYSIVSGNINNAFTINSATGQITVSNSSALNAATNPQFTLQVKVADAGSPALSTIQNVTVNVNDVNEAPSIPAGQVLSISENSGANSIVGTVVATDPDATAPNKTLSYSILSGDVNNAFSINSATGQLVVSNPAALNFEATPQFTLQIQVTDGGTPSLSATNAVTVNVVNVNEPPVILSGQNFLINENPATNAVVGTVVATDPDLSAPFNTLLYSIAGGNTGNAFAINSATGQITVSNTAAVDFESNPLFTLQVNVTDGGGLSATPQSVIIVVNNVNEVPSIPAGQVFSVAEHAAVNTIVNTVTATDPDLTAPNNMLSYSIVSGNNNNAFSINPATGQIAVANSAALTFANGSSYTLLVSATDGGTPALSATQSVTINLVDINEAPTIPAGQSLAVSENPVNGAVVGTVAANDPDPTAPNNTLTYSITGGNIGNAFTINAATGQITINNPNVVNFEATPQFNLQVQVTDGGTPALGATQNVLITVNDLDEAPTVLPNQTFTLPEHSALNTSVGTVIATDPDTSAPNNTLIFSIVGGNTNSAFAINTTTGQITVNTPAALDVTTTPVFQLQVQATDGGGLSNTQTVTVNLTAVNQAPILTNPGPVPIYTHHLKDSIVVLPNITVSDPDSSTDLAQVIISLPIPPGRKNPDVVGINGAAALGTVTNTTVAGRQQISIQLQSGVTTAQVQTFLQQITFTTKGRGLTLTHRDFQIQVVDRQGASSNIITQDIVVRRHAPRQAHR